MKHKKLIIISLAVIILGIIGLGIFKYFTAEDKDTSFTITQKQWIEGNKNKVIDISILNNVPILNYHGEGIFFDFITSFEEVTGLEFNELSYSSTEEAKAEYSFKMVDKASENQILIYSDNYVVVTKDILQYNHIGDIKGLTIGVLKSDLESVNKYLNGSDVHYKTFDTVNLMLTDYESEEATINAVILPKTMYLEKIISNSGYNIAYNITEYTKDYVLSLGANQKLNDILSKYYKKWKSDNYTTSYNTSLTDVYFTFKGVTDNDKVKIKSKRYAYGFVVNAPYDLFVNDKLVGLNNSYMANFAKLANIEISYKDYSNFNALLTDFNENKIDFYFNSYTDKEYRMDARNTISVSSPEFVLVSHFENNITINSLNSLEGVTVHAARDSKISGYLSGFNIPLTLHDNVEDMISKKGKNKIMAMDSSTFDYYSRDKLSKYKVDYKADLGSSYSYLVRDIKDNEIFADYFSFFLSFSFKTNIMNSGYNDVFNAPASPVILERILIIVGALLLCSVTLVLVLRFNPNAKRRRSSSLSKEDKLRYIDMLTSLKNRNYLNDHIEAWDESEVYPQTIIIIDLNDIAYINDNYGHAEGDAVIKEAANILIKNQIANSDIIRTNGNEFLVYLVGYDEKQVVSYIRKLNKEFKELAHGFGAAMGYSIISDAIKTIDDAVNEATLDMRNNKEEIREAK